MQFSTVSEDDRKIAFCRNVPLNYARRIYTAFLHEAPIQTHLCRRLKLIRLISPGEDNGDAQTMEFYNHSKMETELQPDFHHSLSVQPAVNKHTHIVCKVHHQEQMKSNTHTYTHRSVCPLIYKEIRRNISLKMRSTVLTRGHIMRLSVSFV